MNTFRLVKDIIEANTKTHLTSGKGTVQASYHQLEKLFGEPTYNEPSADGKVNFEWVIEFNGDVFTIYDYKARNRAFAKYSLDTYNVGGHTDASSFIAFIERFTTPLVSK